MKKGAVNGDKDLLITFKKLNKALEYSDIKTLSHIFDADFHGTILKLEIPDKDRALDIYSIHKVKFDSLSMLNIAAEIQDDLGIVHCNSHLKGKKGNQEFDYDSKYHFLFHLKKSRWKCIRITES